MPSTQRKSRKRKRQTRSFLKKWQIVTGYCFSTVYTVVAIVEEDGSEKMYNNPKIIELPDIQALKDLAYDPVQHLLRATFVLKESKDYTPQSLFFDSGMHVLMHPTDGVIPMYPPVVTLSEEAKANLQANIDTMLAQPQKLVLGDSQASFVSSADYKAQIAQLTSEKQQALDEREQAVMENERLAKELEELKSILESSEKTQNAPVIAEATKSTPESDSVSVGAVDTSQSTLQFKAPDAKD